MHVTELESDDMTCGTGNVFHLHCVSVKVLNAQLQQQIGVAALNQQRLPKCQTGKHFTDAERMEDKLIGTASGYHSMQEARRNKKVKA